MLVGVLVAPLVAALPTTVRTWDSQPPSPFVIANVEAILRDYGELNGVVVAIDGALRGRQLQISPGVPADFQTIRAVLAGYQVLLEEDSEIIPGGKGVKVFIQPNAEQHVPALDPAAGPLATVIEHVWFGHAENVAKAAFEEIAAVSLARKRGWRTGRNAGEIVIAVSLNGPQS